MDHFELSAIPKAPSWLIGAVNIEGKVLPVVDLALYFSPEQASLSTPKQQRLLVGGLDKENSEDGVALVFGSLPIQLTYEPEALTYGGALPPKLREVCDSVAMDTTGRSFLEVNTDRLMAMLADELSLL